MSVKGKAHHPVTLPRPVTRLHPQPLLIKYTAPQEARALLQRQVVKAQNSVSRFTHVLLCHYYYGIIHKYWAPTLRPLLGAALVTPLPTHDKDNCMTAPSMLTARPVPGCTVLPWPGPEAPNKSQDTRAERE